MNHPDDCTGVPLSSLRDGALFSAVTGFRGMRKMMLGDNVVMCVDYDSGSFNYFDGDMPCWEIRIGGWKPANALPSPEQGRADATFGYINAILTPEEQGRPKG